MSRKNCDAQMYGVLAALCASVYQGKDWRRLDKNEEKVVRMLEHTGHLAVNDPPDGFVGRARQPERVTIKEGAWKGESGWITGPSNALGSYPITLDSGFKLAWYESEFERH